MFTGIIEQLGVVKHIKKEEGNIDFTIGAPFVSELKIDQSVAHNGCCLTVVSINDNSYVVTPKSLNKVCGLGGNPKAI